MISEYSDIANALSYDAATGRISWRVARGQRAAGAAAGNVHPKGYRFITVNRKQFSAHRLAWLLHYGEWPPMDIDHRNGNRDDNRISNLRLATIVQNAQNTALLKRNQSGFRGVSWQSARQKWLAQITVNGKDIYLGRYSSKDDAAAVYQQAARKHFGDFYREAA